MHASQHRHRSILRLCGHFTPLLAKHAFFVSFKLRNCNLPSRICNSNCIDMRLIVAIQSNLHTVICYSEFFRDRLSMEHTLTSKMLHESMTSHS